MDKQEQLYEPSPDIPSLITTFDSYSLDLKLFYKARLARPMLLYNYRFYRSLPVEQLSVKYE